MAGLRGMSYEQHSLESETLHVADRAAFCPNVRPSGSTEWLQLHKKGKERKADSRRYFKGAESSLASAEAVFPARSCRHRVEDMKLRGKPSLGGTRFGSGCFLWP